MAARKTTKPTSKRASRKTLADTAAEHRALGSMEQADAAGGKPSAPEAKPATKRTSKPSTTTSKPGPSTDVDTKSPEDQLRADRTQANNRLSGLKTRLKRLPVEPEDDYQSAHRAGLERRIAELTEHRDAITAQLKGTES